MLVGVCGAGPDAGKIGYWLGFTSAPGLHFANRRPRWVRILRSQRPFPPSNQRGTPRELSFGRINARRHHGTHSPRISAQRGPVDDH